MMAGSEEGGVGAFKGLEGETELCSHQDLVNCGDKFECNGEKNGNVGDDLSGSYVFVGGVGEGSGSNCDGEVKDGVELKGDGGVGNDQDFGVGVDKEVDLHGEFVGEVVESGEVENGIVGYEGAVGDRVESDLGEDLESRAGNALEIGGSKGSVKDRVESDPGENLESRAHNGLEIGGSEGTVKDCVESEPGENLESQADNGLEIGGSEGTVKDCVESEPGENLESRADNGLEIGGSEGTVKDCVESEPGENLESRAHNGLEIGGSEGTVKDRVESEPGENLESRAHNGLEIGGIEGTVKDRVESEPGENLESRAHNGLEIGESEGVVIVSAGEGELLGKSVKDVELNVAVSISEVGEIEQSDMTGLGDVECGLGKVEAEIGEEESQERTELKSVGEDLESEIRMSVEKDQNSFGQMKDLGSDTELGESQEGLIILEDTGESNKSVKAVEQDLSVSPTDFGEGDKSHTVALWADICELEDIQAGIGVDVGEGELKEQTELNSVEESLESKIRTTESVDCLSRDLEENQYKVQHMTDLDREIDGGVQLGSEINAIADKGIIFASATDDFNVGKNKDLDECIDGSQSVDKLDLTPSDAANVCSMDKVPIESCEDITAGTDDRAAVEHEAPRIVVVLGTDAVNSTELDSNINKTYAETIGHVPAKNFGSVRASIDNGSVSDQGSVDADSGVALVHDTDGNGTLTTATRFVTDQSKILQINLGEQKSGCAKSPELNVNPDDAHDCIVPQVQSDPILRSDCNGATICEPEVRDLVCPITDNKAEVETELLDTEDVESGIFCVTDGTKSETGVAHDERSEMKIEFGTIDSAEMVTKSRGHNSLCKSQVLNGDIDSNRNQVTADSVESESCGVMSFKSVVPNHSDMPDKDATLAVSSIGDSVDGQSLGNVAKGKPFQFIAKFPRMDDDKIRELIRDAQVLVEDKTVQRDNIRCEINIKRANLQSVGDEFEATKSAERDARKLVKLKRQEIDSVEDKLTKVKNSISVMDITNRIAHMENMIEHETHPLKEEKQLLREINIMKKLRAQISSNVCSGEEGTQAMSQVVPTEMQLKTLKKELGELKNKVSKAEAAVILLGKQYNDESKRLRELQARFRAANDIRQDAYRDLLGLKRQLHEKSKHYWIYKEEAKAASDYALNGDKEALYRLCAKQVDSFMDLWNNNDEFREDYVRCNMKSTLRRFKTLDGRSLGPDEEVHVYPIYVGEREVGQPYNPPGTTNLSSPTVLKQHNTVQPVEREQIDGKSLVVAEPKGNMLKIKTSVNPIPESGLNIGSGQLEAEEPKEEEKQQTWEELELARKAEMLKKEESAAKLKEQLREEEKAKAQEALERKKRNADKAQKRAALRAQKAAEEKEKEREKRLKKKEKRSTDGENGLELHGLELQASHIKNEVKDSTTPKPGKASHLNKYSKTKATIPPALRNRGKSRLKQFMWWIIGGLLVLFVFLLGEWWSS